MGSEPSVESSTDSLSQLSDSVDRSAIRLMFDLAHVHDGDDTVHLEIGEPDFDTSAHIVQRANEAAAAGETHYTANAGLLELREAIAADTKRTDGVELDPTAEITVTSGAMEALYLALLAVTDPGDDVVIPTPAWPNYENQVRMVGGTPVSVPLSPADDFQLDVDEVCRAITDDTAAVILTTPSNPTGRVYERDAIETIIERAATHGAYVIADEVYKSLTYGDYPTGVLSYLPDAENVLSVCSCSKQFAMTGWRLGWLSGSAEVVDLATRLHENTSACASSISQHAAIAALEGPREQAEKMRTAFSNRRDYVIDRIESIPALSAPEPQGTFYVFVDVSAFDETSLQLSKRLLYDYDVVTAPGEGFGDVASNHLRLSFANSLDRLETGLDRIERLVDDHGL